jgi:hypothetical protein
MLQKKRFGDDRAGTPRDNDPDDRDDQVSQQDEPIAQALNDDSGCGFSQDQDYKSGFDCGKLSIRPDKADSAAVRISGKPRGFIIS